MRIGNRRFAVTLLLHWGRLGTREPEVAPTHHLSHTFLPGQTLTGLLLQQPHGAMRARPLLLQHDRGERLHWRGRRRRSTLYRPQVPLQGKVFGEFVATLDGLPGQLNPV